MSTHTPRSGARLWFVSARAKCVAFVVAALCPAFTEGQAPPASPTGAAGDGPEAALVLAGLQADRAAALGRAQSSFGGGTSRKAADQYSIAGNCGKCWQIGVEHVALEYPDAMPAHGDGEGHGWHGDYQTGLPCLYSHGICVFVPKGGPQMAQSSAGELTDAVVRAARPRTTLPFWPCY